MILKNLHFKIVLMNLPMFLFRIIRVYVQRAMGQNLDYHLCAKIVDPYQLLGQIHQVCLSVNKLKT